MKRRDFISTLGWGGMAMALGRRAFTAGGPDERPNIILCMADDLGWGDTAYNGHPVLKTPNLDAMAGSGIRFDRFYAGAPVCSPTRGSALTGRHPYRYGVVSANRGHLRKEEICLAEVLKEHGYVTGHFGKWHLGTLTKDIRDGRRGGRQNEHYAPPWENGFDVCFSTEQAVPTWDPMENQSIKTKYWVGPGEYATDNLEGCDSRVIMDRAIPFIEDAAKRKQPFFAVVWFHAPHAPVVGGPPYRKMYPDRTEDEQHFYAVVTALDEQVGRLRKKLRDLGVADHTMLWFCSDNGPEGNPGKKGRFQGTAGPFRGRKRSLYEGGVRVAGLLEWPDKVKQPRTVGMPCVTSDYFPTCLDVLGYQLHGKPRPYDGISLLPLIEGRMKERPRPIGFQSAGMATLNDNRFKLVHNPGKKRHRSDNGKVEPAEYELYDLIEDPSETRNIAARHPDVAERMKNTLRTWQASCEASLEGKDY